MKLFCLFYFCFALLACSGQNEPSKKNLLPDQVVNYYNSKKFDSIFYLFSPEMKAALPLKKTTDFFSQMEKDAGTIIKHEFIDKKESFDRYRADFSKGIYWLSLSADKNGEIDGLYFKEYDGPGNTPSMTRNKTPMSLPFDGEWIVFWGGDTKEQNYHVISRSQKNAFDIVIADQRGLSFKTNGKTNEDYYAFGQPLLAPCDAEVISVIDGVRENIPGEMNPAQLTGNTVVLRTTANEYILLAHFKLNSIQVKKGESVKKGQQLGLCGNSGNSSEPHLHFHIQDKEYMMGSTGIKCYFEKMTVNGVVRNDYSPVKGERIKNAD